MMPRLLFVSSAFPDAELREALQKLARFFTLTFVAPAGPELTGNETKLIGSADNTALFRTILLHPLNIGGRRMLLSGLGQLLAAENFDVVLVDAEPGGLLYWQAWFSKRLHRPGALFGELATTRSPSAGGAGKMLYRAANAICDFTIASGSEAAVPYLRSGRHPGQLLESVGEISPAQAERWAKYIQRRLAAEKRSVLWVDPHLEERSPSTKHLLYTRPVLEAAGWEIRAWCARGDHLEGVEVCHFPSWFHPNFDFMFFWLLSNIYAVWRRWLTGRKPAAVVHSVAQAYMGADVCTLQFHNWTWVKKSLEIGFDSWRDAVKLGLHLVGIFQDEMALRASQNRLFLPVSHGLADAIAPRLANTARVSVLPNSYDENRFSPAVRERWREPVRERLGLGLADFVFSFVGQGDFRRKGLDLALAALSILRRGAESASKPWNLKFLLIGGRPATVRALKERLGKQWPDHEEWIVLIGAQPAPEQYLAASDAFLFPSHFEAFSLAEIEAGALGLPLLLTRHWGAEMVLEAGVNGAWLDFDPVRMAQQIRAFLDGPITQARAFVPHPGEGLSRPAFAERLLAHYESFVPSPSPALGSDLDTGG